MKTKKMAEPSIGYLNAQAKRGLESGMSEAEIKSELEVAARMHYESRRGLKHMGGENDLRATYAYDVNAALHPANKDAEVATIVLEALSNFGRKFFD